MRSELRQSFRRDLRTKPKAVILAEALPFDPFELKVYQVVNIELVPPSAAFEEKLKKLVVKQKFFNLELLQRARNQVAIKSMQLIEDAILSIENEADFDDPPSFEYTSENIFTSEFAEVKCSRILGCHCEGGCSEKSNCCPQQEGLEFPYINLHGREVHRHIHSQKMIECGPACTCDKNCLNRLTQKKKTVKVCVFKTENRGWGLKATEEIKARSFIGQYTGEVLRSSDVEKREESMYLFEVNSEEHDDPITIDAKKHGNVTRFINHSCEPNTHVRYVNFHGGKPEQEKICIFSSKIIKKGEEITISYTGGQKKREYSSVKCQCGAAKCNGLLF